MLIRGWPAVSFIPVGIITRKYDQSLFIVVRQLAPFLYLALLPKVL